MDTRAEELCPRAYTSNEIGLAHGLFVSVSGSYHHTTWRRKTANIDAP